MNHEIDTLTQQPIFKTAKELENIGIDSLPWQFLSQEHLILSSPATLSFNSPGAKGYGVKRAALSIPDSLLLLVSPGCCGRNTSGIERLPEYKNRFYFLMMDDTDIVTGRHLKKLSAAALASFSSYKQRSGRDASVIMICITCVDALLGTDMERICRQISEHIGIPVRPCYMYALTREGKKPPMVHIRQSLYALLEKKKKNPRSINLLGYFSPLQKDCELYDIFRSFGITTIREISRCRDYHEFLQMAEANFNVVLDPLAHPAAADLAKRLQIPYIELHRLYRPKQVARQYQALAQALDFKLDVTAYENRARTAIKAFQQDFTARFDHTPRFAVGSCINADSFELALALIEEGFIVSEIYSGITTDNYRYIKKIAALSPDTRIYADLDLGMLRFTESSATSIDIALGMDACYYNPKAIHVPWNTNIQPFGFLGIEAFYHSLRSAIEDTPLTKEASATTQTKPSFLPAAMPSLAPLGFRRFLSPFAPDTSGAASVLYELGGLTVVCDAGGCAGNIAGFDEPRLSLQKSALASAGLRDMDAILGRDDKLLEKLLRGVESAGKEHNSFCALIGTPVSSVIGTDYTALARMVKKKTGTPTLCIDTSGTYTYDYGVKKAFLALFSEFTKAPRLDIERSTIGLLGATPLDISMKECKAFFQEALGTNDISCFCMGDGLEAIPHAGECKKNIVLSPSAIPVAIYLQKHFLVPYEISFPGAALLLEHALSPVDEADRKAIFSGKRVLILQQHVLALTLASIIEERGANAVQTASWFSLVEGREGHRLLEEDDLIQLIQAYQPDIILSDRAIEPLIQKAESSALLLDMPHFAVSGRLLSLKEEHITKRIRVYGIVQGVGFRPTVCRYAREAHLTGSVCNMGPFVEIIIQGKVSSCDTFLNRLRDEPPKRAFILGMDESTIRDSICYSDFSILESEKKAGSIYLSPDIAICEDCRRELYDRTNRRYLHPFINCTNCGPRLTILDAFPYDRARTSMRDFPMCLECEKEYHSTADRRFDAQPVCCNDCGPQVYILDKQTGEPADGLIGRAAIICARETLLSGGIVAIKGIGGFHLCADATNEAAVASLRSRKMRPNKPFAVMADTIEHAKQLCDIDKGAASLLSGHQKPIVLLKKNKNNLLAYSVAPHNPYLGLMLPYAPIQLLLFNYDDGLDMPHFLVMTSANDSGAPICKDDSAAAGELSALADVILSNNRPILVRADDSVVGYYHGSPYMIRRSRGYAPLPFRCSFVPDSTFNVLGIGGELKNSFCIGRGDLFYPSAYIGDLGDIRTEQALDETLQRFFTLFEAKPSAICCDLHPLYRSRAIAYALAKKLSEPSLPVFDLQHHYAHILSCMAENDCAKPVIGVSFDGTGYGSDGTIWGGEILLCDWNDFSRFSHIIPFLQIGGDVSAREGWRIAVSMIDALYENERASQLIDTLGLCSDTQHGILHHMAERRLNTILSTSAGRLFDAVSALLGICRVSTYEGEASTALMYAAMSYTPLDSDEAFAITPLTESGLLNSSALVKQIIEELSHVSKEERSCLIPRLSYLFHRSLADMIVAAVAEASVQSGRKTVAISGGVFQNTLLLELTKEALEKQGLQVLRHHLIPPNDGGIGLGQAVYASLHLNKQT